MTSQQRDKIHSPSSREEDNSQEAEGPNALIIFDSNSATIQKFKPESDDWDTTDNGFSEDMKKWGFSAAVLDKALLIFMNNKAVYRYQRKKSIISWHRLPDMTTIHGQRPPAVVLNDTMYAIGSAGVGLHTNKGEKYSVSRRKWMLIENMVVARRNHSIVATEGSIYCLGGQNEKGTMLSVEAFDATTKHWSKVADLPEPRHSAAAVASGSDIFVMGGFVNGKRRHDMICISIPSALCITLAHMNMTRTTFSSFIIDGKIFAVGGDNSRHDTVEVYDAEKDSWEFMDILATLQIEAAVSMRL
ncbi:alpha-scruin-like isoform X1 [Styela clava]